MNDEKTIWRGSPSQVVCLKTYILCGLVILLDIALIALAFWKGINVTSNAARYAILGGLFLGLIIPLFIILWRWVLIRSRVYELTTQRIKVTTGILNKRTEEMELYRVKDYSLVEPFTYRLFGVGNIDILTYDTTTPTLQLEAIPKASDIREQFRTYVEACRTQKGVHLREVE